MNEVTYRTRVQRKRGKWRVSVPALPRDAPVVVTTKLGNAAPILIEQLAEYLGISVSAISVDIKQPARARRRPARDRLTATLVQAWGGLGALTGLYLVTGVAATLMTASLAAIVLGALRESGRI